MSEQSRTTLKGYFESGDTPTEAQFIDLIDSLPNFVDDFATKYVKTTVSSAEILALNTTPKTLVAAPGAGKILLPLFAIAKLTYGSVAYGSTNNDPEIRLDGESAGSSLWFNNILSQSSDYIQFAVLDATGTTNHTENAALVLTEDVDPTIGDGTLVIYLWYKEVTL